MTETHDIAQQFRNSLQETDQNGLVSVELLGEVLKVAVTNKELAQKLPLQFGGKSVEVALSEPHQPTRIRLAQQPQQHQQHQPPGCISGYFHG